MQTAVNAETIVGLKSNILIRNSNICCFRVYCLSNNIASKPQIQELTVKDPYSKKPKAKEVKPAYVKIVEFLKEKDKKKKTKEYKWYHIRKRKKILVTGNNTINALKKNLGKKRNVSKIIFYNCNKKKYYISTYTKPLKNKCWS